MSKRADTKRDASLDPVLNGVRLPDGSVVAWAVAFPRPELERRRKDA